MLDELLGHLGERPRRRRGPGPRALLDRPHGPLGRRRRPRAARRRRAACAGCSSSPTSTTSSPAFPKPTVAACHGACVGGGAEIAVACDLRVGGSNLRLRFPGAALGVPVGPARLVTLCGLSVAKYLLLTSKEVDADVAYRWGLVHKVVPAPRTEEAALQLAGAGRRPPARGGRAAEADAARVGRRRGAARGSRARARSTGSAPARACRTANSRGAGHPPPGREAEGVAGVVLRARRGAFGVELVDDLEQVALAVEVDRDQVGEQVAAALAGVTRRSRASRC